MTWLAADEEITNALYTNKKRRDCTAQGSTMFNRLKLITTGIMRGNKGTQEN